MESITVSIGPFVPVLDNKNICMLAAAVLRRYMTVVQHGDTLRVFNTTDGGHVTYRVADANPRPSGEILVTLSTK